MRLKDKVAIITGAGSGIGAATAKLFAEEGARVLIADWSEKNGNQTLSEIKAFGGEGIFIKTDVSKADDIEEMVEICVKNFGRVDILMNNAGIVKQGKITEFSEADWDTVLGVDLKGTFLGCKKVIPIMEKQGGGKIVNIASIAGLVGFDNLSAYCAAKGGVIACTRELALECAPKKINVNCIAPGIIKTAMTKDTLTDPAQKRAMELGTPYPRLGEPEDIAYAALYLASEESDFVNGEVLVVDGGWTVK